MTDVDEPMIGLRVSSERADVPLVKNALSVGQQLQRARLDAGISLESVSARLKVSVARLQAFETDQFDHGANVHLGRAMVASVARFLGLDAQALLSQLPQPPQQVPAPGLHAAPGVFGKETRLTMRRDLPVQGTPVWWLALVLLVLAAVVYFSPQLAHFTGAVTTPPSSQPAMPTAPTGSPQAAEAAASLALSLPMIPASTAAAVAAEGGVSAGKAVPSVLLFKARASSWIEVTDAKGTVLLRRTLVASEAAEVGGELPLSVVVGRADHTDVMVRGVPFPLETHTQDNVARFKVP